MRAAISWPPISTGKAGGMTPARSGSWGKLVLAACENELGLMQTVELQDEESLVTIAIGFALQGLDFVVDAFQRAGRDRKPEVVENSRGMDPHRLRQADHLGDPTFDRLLAPSKEPAFRGGVGGLLPHF